MDCKQCRHFIGCDFWKIWFYKVSGEECKDFKKGDSE
jgi:hypothetical protein